jgi:hypothetical protein
MPIPWISAGYFGPGGKLACTALALLFSPLSKLVLVVTIICEIGHTGITSFPEARRYTV